MAKIIITAIESIRKRKSERNHMLEFACSCVRKKTLSLLAAERDENELLSFMTFHRRSSI
jgi:hypothetical protein